MEPTKGQLPVQRGKTYILRILSIYGDLFRAKYGFQPTITFAKYGRLLKTLMEHHTEMQIAALLCVFFNWRGMTDDNDFEEQKLQGAGHSLGWFFNSVNQYEAYTRNVLGVDFEDEKAVREFVVEQIRSLSTS